MPAKEGLDLGRRTWLKAVGAGAAGIAAVGEVSAGDQDTYHKVVNVAEEGGARDASEPINDILEEHRGDSVLFKFPEGRYLMDRQFRHTDFEEFGMAGDDATLVPAPADEFEGESRLFKLGTYYAPGQRLRIENFTVDFTADNTGLRAFQCQIADDLQIRDVTVEGQHDAGTWGPMLVDLVTDSGTGVVENVTMADGAKYTENTPQDANPTVDTGPTGMIVGPHHTGRLTVRDCVVGPFPDNGLYSSGTDGQVVVEGGSFRNSNVANIRLAGDSAIDGAEVVVDRVRPEDVAQVGIRLDSGRFDVSNATLTLSEPTGAAVRIRDSSQKAVLSGLDVRLAEANTSNDAIIVEGGAGPTRIDDSAIEMNCAGQALIFEAGDGAPAVAKAVRITGTATGEYGGRHAIRIECGGCTLTDVQVSQPGPGRRRALYVGGDDVTVSGGEYHSSHYPIVNNASGTRIEQLTAWAEGETEAVKLYDGNRNVEMVYSTLYDGYVDYGTENLSTAGNEYPEGEPDGGEVEAQSTSESEQSKSSGEGDSTDGSGSTDSGSESGTESSTTDGGESSQSTRQAKTDGDRTTSKRESKSEAHSHSSKSGSGTTSSESTSSSGSSSSGSDICPRD